MRCTWPLALLLATTGCASTTYKATLPDISTNCVDRLEEIAAISLRYPLPDAELPQPVEFASIATCYRPAESDPTPVALYRLDGVAPPAELQVSVMLSTGGTLAAVVQVLDADLQPLWRYGFDQFTRRGSLYSLNVFLNPSRTMPAYLLLAPDETQVGKSDTALGSTNDAIVIAGPAGMFIYNNGIETNSVRPFFEGGKVLVTAHPQLAAPMSHD